MLRYIKKIVRDSHGTTALEFALVSPIVILLIVGAIFVARSNKVLKQGT